MRTLQAVAVSAVLTCLLSGSSAPAQDWDVFALHPFAEVTVDNLPLSLTEPLEALDLTALQNDWAHDALAVKATGDRPATVSLSLRGHDALLSCVKLRVLGFVQQTGIGTVMDPIFDAPGVVSEGHRRFVLNYEHIADFPTVTATPEHPVVVWVTADTRGLAPGGYEGSIRVTAPDGTAREYRLVLRVRPVELPVENPLISMGWHWLPTAPGMAKEDSARLFLSYGLNATHLDRDMEPSRAAGFRFFIFVFGPSWKNSPPEEADAEAVAARIAQIREMIARLNLRPDQWALYTLDEPNDKSAPNQAKWAAHLRNLWPEARFLYNPGWGPGPRNEWGSVDKTIEPLGAWAGIWLPYSHWLWDDQAARSLPLMRRQAEQVWFYEIMNFTYTRRTSVGRGMMRTLPWVAWKYRLQGACWYSLNAISDVPYKDDAKGQEYAASYYTVPARSLEALREGFQEYKRLARLRDAGVDEATLDGFADRVLGAAGIAEVDEARREMTRLLVERAG